MRVHYCTACIRFFRALGGAHHCPRCGQKASA